MNTIKLDNKTNNYILIIKIETYNHDITTQDRRMRSTQRRMEQRLTIENPCSYFKNWKHSIDALAERSFAWHRKDGVLEMGVWDVENAVEY